MSSGIYGVALSGLNAAQVGMRTTGQNISNVSTPGYSRQQLEQSSGVGQATGVGFLGLGPEVTAVRRVYAEYLVTQAQSQQAQGAALNTRSTELARLGNLLADGDANLGAAFDSFFGAVDALAARPGDSTARQALLAGGQTLVARFAGLDAAFNDIATRLDHQVRGSVELINSTARQIATLNGAIANAASLGVPPNDMLDQRDALLTQLNLQVRGVVVREGDMTNVFLANGQPLVLGNSALSLVTMADSLDATRLQIGLASGGTVQQFRQGDPGGGALGGMLAFRDGPLVQARNEIGRLAMSLATSFNAQHALGQDGNGGAGAAFFAAPTARLMPATTNTGTATLTPGAIDAGSLTASDYVIEFDGSRFVVTKVPEGTQTNFLTFPQILGGVQVDLTGYPIAGDRFLLQPTRSAAGQLAMALTQASAIATAAPVLATAGGNNLGAGSLTLTAISSRDVDLRAPVTITFTGPNTFNVSGAGTGDPTGLTYTPGMTLAFNGWSARLDGAVRSGDRFTISASDGAAGDNFNAVLLGRLGSAALVDGSRLSGAFARLVGTIGAQGQEATLGLHAQERLIEGSEQAVAAVSGVNLDEEAANLMRYQQAYQAAGKLITVANTLFDSLLQAVR